MIGDGCGFGWLRFAFLIVLVPLHAWSVLQFDGTEGLPARNGEADTLTNHGTGNVCLPLTGGLRPTTEHAPTLAIGPDPWQR